MRESEPKGRRVTLRKNTAERRAGSFRDKLDWPWLCRVVAARGVAPAEVEDVAQDALLAAARVEARRPICRAGQCPREARRALLSRLVRCFAAKLLGERGFPLVAGHACVEATAHDAPNVEELLVKLEDEGRRKRLLEAALAQLAAEDALAHALLVAHELDGHRVAAIAKRLAIPDGTAHTRLRRARRHLGALLRTATLSRTPLHSRS
jgi:DNA-directed RNA polymerase specialized sigma24 family protein